MVVYIAMDQMVGDRRSPGEKILGGVTVYLIRQPSNCSRRHVPRRDALWTVCEMAGPVLPDGFDVAASQVLTVEAAAFQVIKTFRRP